MTGPLSPTPRSTMRLLTTLLLAGAAGCGGGAGDGGAGRQVLKVGQILPEEHPTTRAIAIFRARVEALAGDALTVRLFPNSQLGDTHELIAGCQAGNIEAAVVSAAPLAQHVPALNVVVMPFVFRDNAHQYAVLDGPVGEALRAQIAEVGLVAVAFFDAGSRNVMTKSGPIRTPADLAGLKIRVMDSNALRAAVERLGATAVPLSQGEVYSALQTGVIDGWENNPATCLTYSMYETGCRHFAWTRHVAIPDVLILSRAWYEALPEPVRLAVEQAARETRDAQRKLWQEDEGRAVAELAAAGMIFTEVEASAFAGRFDGFYDGFIERYGDTFARLLEQVRRQGGDGDAP